MTTDAAALLTRDVPRDQALGLRLLALARVAAAMHMGGVGQAVLGADGADSGAGAQDAERLRQLLRSQAAGLMGMQRNGGESETPHFVRGS